MTTPASGDLNAPPHPSEPMGTIRIGAALVMALVFLAAIIFVPAGTWDWTRGWLYVALITANFVGNLIYLNRVNPELIGARLSVRTGTKTWDIAWGAVFGPVMFAVFVVAGLDAVRFSWTSMSPWLWFVGIALFVPGTLLFTWAMGVNPFFEKTVRIQTDRGHRVIDTGPYQLVRHPGYVGFFGWFLSVPFLLGSWWSLVPAGAAVAGLIVRTALEDRTLRAELSGYDEYASRVRYRLLPGVW